MSQNHFTLSFSWSRSRTQKCLRSSFHHRCRSCSKRRTLLTRCDYSRFTVLSEKTLLFLGDMAGKVWQWAKDW
jgi:hypothetical protein